MLFDSFFLFMFDVSACFPAKDLMERSQNFVRENTLHVWVPVAQYPLKF